MLKKISWVEADFRTSVLAQLVEKLSRSDSFKNDSGTCGCGAASGCASVSAGARPNKAAPH